LDIFFRISGRLPSSLGWDDLGGGKRHDKIRGGTINEGKNLD